MLNYLRNEGTVHSGQLRLYPLALIVQAMAFEDLHQISYVSVDLSLKSKGSL